MNTDKRYSGPADPSTPCTECGGPTYTFPSGSVWCPAEDPHPGGYFVVRVAFERAPVDEHEARGRAIKAPTGKAIEKAWAPAVKAVTKPKKQPAFGGGYDDFVESDR